MTERPRRSRRWVILAASLAAAVALGLWLRPSRAAAPELIPVQQGTLVLHRYETARIQPRDAVMVKAAFNGRVQSIVDDGLWVEAGALLFVLDDSEESKRVADERSQLITARQELRLARVRRAQAQDSEDAKVNSASRAAGLEGLRLHVLEATPPEGDALVVATTALAPLEARVETLREAFLAADGAWGQALDAYLALADRQQEQRDRRQRLQSQADEARTLVEQDPEQLSAPERQARNEAQTRLDEATTGLAILAKDDGLIAQLTAARATRDQARSARDEAEAALNAAEPAYLAVELAKRGLDAALLALDEASQDDALVEAQRKLTQGRLSASAGAMATMEVEDLDAAAAKAANQLDITRRRLAMARRGAAPEVLVEARARAQRAREKAAAAQAARDRALALLDGEIAVAEAKVRRLRLSVERISARFPDLLRSYLELLAQERSALDPDDRARAAELDDEEQRTRAQLATAQADQPGVFRAPCAGLVRLRDLGERKQQVGDQVWPDDVLVELFPPANMEVLMAVNEVAVRHVRPGQSATIAVAALGGRTFAASVAAVSGIGRDKFAAQNRFADVTQYEARLGLADPGTDLRQGMTALVELAVESLPGVTWLPRAAVRAGATATSFRVRVGAAGVWTDVTGAYAGDHAVRIDDGLSPGTLVWATP